MRFAVPNRNRKLAALVAAVVCASASAASAQRVVVFGDSLSDSGNVNAITGGALPGSPLGRYSNGLNWADLAFGSNPALGFGLGGAPTGKVTGYDNYAVGGAFTGSGNLNPALPIGMAQEIATFKALGGKFSATDLVSLWGGANNGFAAVQPGATAASIGAAAGSSAVSQIGNVQSVIGLGARQILVLNLPDLGATPALMAAGAAASQGGSLYTFSFNAALKDGLTQVAAAAPGVNIVQADIATAFKVMLANPGAYGFTNTTTPCGFNGGAACNGVVFGDLVHPTQAAYAWVARYIGLLLDTAPAIASTQPLGEIGMRTSELASNAVFDRLSNWVSGTYALKNGAFAEVLGQFGSYEDTFRGTKTSHDINMGGARLGYDRGFGSTLLGGSVAFLGGNQESSGLKNDIMTLRGDLYGTVMMGPFYVSATGGLGSLSLDNIERETGMPTVTAKGSTNGYVANAAGEIGIAQRVGGITLIPSARANYIYSKLSGYQEQADLLALQYEDRTTSYVLGSARLRAVSDVTISGVPSAIYGEIGYEGFLSRDNGTLQGRLVDNTALPVIVDPSNPAGAGVLGKIGITTSVKDSLYVDLNYGVSAHDEGGLTHSASGRLKAHF